MIIIEENQVRELLTPEKCIAAMKDAFMDLESGKCTMPLRSIHVLPNTAKFGFMPAYLGDYFGAKVISAFPPNMGTEYPSHIGYVMLFESQHCTVSAMVDASSITEIRTASSSQPSRFPKSGISFMGSKSLIRDFKVSLSMV